MVKGTRKRKIQAAVNTASEDISVSNFECLDKMVGKGDSKTKQTEKGISVCRSKTSKSMRADNLSDSEGNKIDKDKAVQLKSPIK